MKKNLLPTTALGFLGASVACMLAAVAVAFFSLYRVLNDLAKFSFANRPAPISHLLPKDTPCRRLHRHIHAALDHLLEKLRLPFVRFHKN